jgi:hypothetical protein
VWLPKSLRDVQINHTVLDAMGEKPTERNPKGFLGYRPTAPHRRHIKPGGHDDNSIQTSSPNVPHLIFLQNFRSAKHLSDVKELGVPNDFVTLADEGQ